MSIELEDVSPGFGMNGVSVRQTLKDIYAPYSGINILTNNDGSSRYINTQQGLQETNLDGRIPLGMFFFDESNQSEESFPNVLSPPFITTIKQNLVRNGDCKYAEQVYVDGRDIEEINDEGSSFRIIKPQGGWNFMSVFSQSAYSGYPFDDYSNDYIPFGSNPHVAYQNITDASVEPYSLNGGDYMKLGNDDYESPVTFYWNVAKRDEFGFRKFFYETQTNSPNSGHINWQSFINSNIDTEIQIGDIHEDTGVDGFRQLRPTVFDSITNTTLPPIATWVENSTNRGNGPLVEKGEAFSNDRC
jgi:hypothetical protein